MFAFFFRAPPLGGRRGGRTQPRPKEQNHARTTADNRRTDSPDEPRSPHGRQRSRRNDNPATRRPHGTTPNRPKGGTREPNEQRTTENRPDDEQRTKDSPDDQPNKEQEREQREAARRRQGTRRPPTPNTTNNTEKQHGKHHPKTSWHEREPPAPQDPHKSRTLKKRTSRQRQSFWSHVWLDERRECNRKRLNVGAKGQPRSRLRAKNLPKLAIAKLLLPIRKFFEGCPTRKLDIIGGLRGRSTPWLGVARNRFCRGAVKERFPAGASDGLTARTKVSSRSRFPRRRREFAKAAANPLFPLLPTEPPASCPLAAVYFNKVRRCLIWLFYRLSTIFKSFTVNISTL